MTVGLNTSQRHLAAKEHLPYLCLPDCQSRSGEGCEQLSAPRDSNRDDLAVHIVLRELVETGYLTRSLLVFFRFHLLFPSSRLRTVSLIRGLSLGFRRAISPILRGLVGDIVGHRRALEIRILGGRKDGGRGDGPIRHGGLRAIDGFICACPSHWRGVRLFAMRVLVELCRAVAVRRPGRRSTSKLQPCKLSNSTVCTACMASPLRLIDVIMQLTTYCSLYAILIGLAVLKLPQRRGPMKTTCGQYGPSSCLHVQANLNARLKSEILVRSIL